MLIARDALFALDDCLDDLNAFDGVDEERDGFVPGWSKLVTTSGNTRTPAGRLLGMELCTFGASVIVFLLVLVPLPPF